MQRLSHELHLALSARVPTRAVLWAGSQAALPLFAPLAAARAAAWLARGCAGDVVLAGDAVLAPVGLALGRAFGRPVAVVAHGLDVVYPNVLHQAIVPPSLRRADLVIAISGHVRDVLIQRGVEPDRCVAIPLAVEAVPLPGRAQARARLGRRLGLDLGDRPVLMWIGRMVPRKGVAWFVRECLPRVTAVVPDALCLVAGDGPARASIEALAGGLPGESLRVLGRVDDATRADLWAGSDVFLMPNQPLVGDLEGFGLVAAEAAHAGLPTVASAVEGIADAVVDDVTGVLVPPGKPEAFADAVVRLLRDPAERARLGASARSEATSRFSWEAVGDRFAEALWSARR
jgi:phosphatidylinositol alpha-1,6-mannosyltransferase